MVFHWTRLRKSGVLPRISPQGAWDHVAEDMLLKFAGSGHPIFRATTPLSRGKLKNKGKGILSIHFTADPDTIDNLSHHSLCQSAQYLRGSGSYMRWMWRPARWHGGTRNTGGSINCSQRSQSWSTCSGRTWRFQHSFAKIFSTSQTTFTRRQIE